MKTKLCFCTLVFALASLSSANAQTKMPAPWHSSFVSIDDSGKLVYTPDEQGNIIPDFSLVGYHHGDVAIPHHAATIVLKPLKGDNWAQIQEAVDKVSAMAPDASGHRGTVLLSRGTYMVSRTISIAASGVVLSGEGSRIDETRLVATSRTRHSLIRVSGKGSVEEVKGTRVALTDSYVPVGAHSFNVSSAKGFKAGDRIILYRPGTKEWIHELKMDQIVERQGTRQWTPQEYNFSFEREITKVSGKTIWIDNPVVLPLEARFGGAEIFKYTYDGRICECGVTDLCIESEFEHYEDNEHGWIAVQLDDAENCWVSNITSRYFGYACVSCERGAKNVTVRDCRSLHPKSVITGGLRYSFNNCGQQNLFMDCQAQEGRHDYVTGSQVCGPNVFYNCTASQSYADIGPHHRWAMGTLFDNIVTDGQINVQDRGKMGSGHGWAGVTQVLWNCTAGSVVLQNPWTNGKNYSIGTKAEKKQGAHPDRMDGEWEGQGETNVFPRSLFLAQLLSRHGVSLVDMNRN